MKAIILFIWLASFLALPLAATIINVPDDQPTIQTGIDAGELTEGRLVKERFSAYEDLMAEPSGI